VNFTAAGQHLVTGETVTAKTVRSGWGEIKVISPVASTSSKAVYKLLCAGSSVAGVTSSPAAPSTTLPLSSPGNSGGGTLALSATGVTGPWPLGQQFPGATVTVSGGQAPYTWYTSDLPGGMTATPEGATLAIGGTPTELGNFTIEVTVADSAKPQEAGSYRLPFEVAETPAQPQGSLKLDDLFPSPTRSGTRSTSGPPRPVASSPTPGP
jgi:hypothetical protein